MRLCSVYNKVVMDRKMVDSITAQIVELQDEDGCWNVLGKDDRHYPALNYYVPNYRSTLWTLVLLADIQCESHNARLVKPLQIMSDHFRDGRSNIFSIGKSHFPIPCLNGNMLYLHSYFHCATSAVEDLIDFFAEYQRFDDGDFRTPSSFPYYSNRSCYGKHTCYWGVIKLLKGLSFIPPEKRSNKAEKLLDACIDFVLLHEVCFSSRNSGNYLHTNIEKLTFPNMYQADFLEILWLLKREGVKSRQADRALDLLKNKRAQDGTWKIERPMKNLIIPMGRKNYGNAFITERAGEVLDS